MTQHDKKIQDCMQFHVAESFFRSLEWLTRN